MLLRSPHRPARRGVVLLAVLVVLVLMSLAAYRYSEWMSAEFRAADAAVKGAQARAVADSGVHYTAAMLVDVEGSLGGNPFDNPGSFQGVSVGGEGRPGQFSVYALRGPDDGDGPGYRYGVTDEAGKINLNALLALDRGKGEVGKKVLLALPDMSEDVADAILDWMSPPGSPRETQASAADAYYSTQSPPYRRKKGPFDSLEELLLVQGVTPALLFGTDRNRNGVIDADEGGGGGAADLGWSAYLTVYSREVNLAADGTTRIFLNDPDLNALGEKLTAALGEDLANFVLAYRMYGAASSGSGSGGRGGGSSGGGGFTAMASDDRTAAAGAIRGSRGRSGSGKNRVRSIYDLVDAKVNVPTGTGSSARSVSYPSPLSDPGQQKQLLALLLDKTTTNQNADLTPRINVNTAPGVVLQGLWAAAGLTDADGTWQSVLDARPKPGSGGDDLAYRTPAWLVSDAGLKAATLKKLERYITARSQVYRFQVRGSVEGGPSARVEAVVDSNQGRPRIVYWRDLSELGPGFDQDDGR